MANRLFIDEKLKDNVATTNISANLEIIRYAESRLLQRRTATTKQLSTPARHITQGYRRATDANLRLCTPKQENDIEEIILDDLKPTGNTRKIKKIPPRTAVAHARAKLTSVAQKGQVSARLIGHQVSPPYVGHQVSPQLIDHQVSANDKGVARRLKFGLVIAKKQAEKDKDLYLDKPQHDKYKQKLVLCQLTINNVNKFQQLYSEKETREMLLKRHLQDLIHFKQVVPSSDNDVKMEEHLGFRKKAALHDSLGIRVHSTNEDDNVEIEEHLKQEKLLHKLTRSLPFHLLIKAEKQRTHNIGDVLGYNQRKYVMIDNEKQTGHTLNKEDKRFQRLMTSLSHI